MLDIKLLRNDLDRVKKALARRKEEIDFDGFLKQGREEKGAALPGRGFEK